MSDELIHAPEDPPAVELDPPRRSAEEDRFLTNFARNYTTGRRILCGVAHAVATLGAAAAAISLGWHYLQDAVSAVVGALSHTH